MYISETYIDILYEGKIKEHFKKHGKKYLAAAGALATGAVAVKGIQHLKNKRSDAEGEDTKKVSKELGKSKKDVNKMKDDLADHFEKMFGKEED